MLILGAANGWAQQSQPAQSEQSAGAQVRTGSRIGEGDLTSRLAALLFDHQFREMQTLLEDGDAASALSEDQKELYRGVLANRENKPQDSIRLLEPLVSKDTNANQTANLPENKLLQKTLAEDYLRSGDLSKAAVAYRNYAVSAGLSADEKSEIELPLQLLPLAAGNPPMTVEPGDAFSLPDETDPLGLTDIPVFVDALPNRWMLDPTAPFNLISRSTAKQVGLKISDESATVRGITGRPMQMHMTLIPRITLGTVTFRNMTAFVFDDADYYFPQSHYQVRGVLGYPAVSALGSLTITADAHIEVQPGEKGERLTAGAPFYLDGDRVIAAFGAKGDERMFAIDAAGQQTYLTSRYLAEHPADFADKKMQLLNVPGSQNEPPAPAYVAGEVSLMVGDTPMTVREIQVLTQPVDSAAVDDTYGTLGADALEELKSYTFDYRTMRFVVRNQ